MMKKIFLGLAMAVLGSAGLYAQFSLSGELRPRSEFRHGYKTLIDDGEAPAFFTSQRTRLSMAVDREKFSMKLSFQDVRTWGNTSQASLSDNTFSVFEAWAELRLGASWSVRLGRQALSYDDQRILGVANWSQQSRKHDLGLLKYETPGLKVHAGVAYNQDSERISGNLYTQPNNYKTMQFVWVHTGAEWWGTSLLLVNNGLQFTGLQFQETRFSQLAGTYTTLSLESLSATLSAYYQGGRDLSDRRISAYLLAMDLSFPFSGPLTPGLGFQVLSGTGEDEWNEPGARNHSFNPLYGTNHKFNGLMDYFYTGNHLDNVGLVDVYLKLAWERENWDAGLNIHYFRTEAAMNTGDPETPYASRGLGFESDLVAGYRLNDDIRLSAGYSQLFGTRYLEQLKGGGNISLPQNWVWLMISFSTEFFRWDGPGS